MHGSCIPFNGSGAVFMDEKEIRTFAREIATRGGNVVSDDEFEDLVRIIHNFWADVEAESERISIADKESVILHFNLMVDCLTTAYMQKYRMDTAHAHSKAYEEITGSALNLIYKKGCIKDFFVQFESIPLRNGVYKEFLTEKTLRQEQAKLHNAELQGKNDSPKKT